MMIVKHQSLYVFAAILILFCLSACQPEPPDRAAETAFKGMEIYSWKAESGEWQYALLPGTNRIKTIAEVVEYPLDQQALEAALFELAAGETVFWSTRVTGEDASITLAHPPQGIIDEITQRATEADVHVILICP